MLSLLRKFRKPVWRPPHGDETDMALRVLFENGAAGIAELNLETSQFVRVNRRYAEIMRRSVSEILTLGPAKLIHPGDIERVRDEWVTSLDATGQWDSTVRHIGPAAETIWVRLGVSVLKRDQTGKPTRSIAVAQDISESIQATERLRESEQLLRLGQQIARIGSFVRDLETGRVTLSEELCDMFGLPRDAGLISTEHWLKWVHPEDRRRVVDAMRSAIDNRARRLACAYRLLRPGDGGLRHVEMRAHYQFDAEGRPIRSFGVVMDKTESELAEEKVRASETVLRLGMTAGGIGAFRRDIQSGDIVCGAETRTLHGLPADAPFSTQDWLATMLPEDSQRVAREIEDCLARRCLEFSSYYRFRPAPDAPVRHIEVRSQNTYDAEGRPLTSNGVIIDVTQRIEAEEKLAHAARHDALTGLPNRVLFRERMDHALARARRGQKFALLCLDLDRFKEVNDTLGHPMGDSLLVEAAARLGQQLRDTDTLARLGGDEFAIIQSNLRTPSDSVALARRVIDCICAPFEIDGHQLVVGVSVGIAIAPEDGAQYEDLFKAADMALYRAKADGRGGWRWFEPEMNERMQLRRAVEVDLRQALERGEFELRYQPVVDTATRRIKSFEALIRWRHPERGLIAPDAFIPLAEEIGLIAPLGAWVLREACMQAARWPEPISVAVNISPVQFAGRRLLENVETALAQSGLAPHRLEIEITETAVLQNTDSTLGMLHDLKKLGARIAMDDFGAGYSSLSSLQSFPFDKVKIDRAFTRGLEQSRKSDAIIAAVTNLCKGLDMCATAEGVETESQFEALRRRGCQEAQGYLFSRPCAPEEIPALIEQLGFFAGFPQAAE
ncbi:diguanylate cyclase (GGDEF)-like protein/PAS domain S-box-containing protein [Rhodoblastus acidophilus]|uniref:sensor domain-containing protein n=1 Tax=Rhodoblastus acidophilus TaxID=1074 RepID=UPI002224059D|nr:EAL domain-containing protein [Rhodoblastus acidophilus]MCW2286629.1 diguanylate cyclase (GGDEF)-like protein/PAS domain S-box-containing protein [Rhodoblastus acidophilus]MCW2335459.1 diguanylate cyclase (GGDEF)-like protein/PAS domain S-box-containing protein [Rhodoblastus acidophilus]